LNQARFALRDVGRNLAAVILFIAMLAFTAAFLDEYINDALLFQDVLTQINRVQEHRIVNFAVIHPQQLLIKAEMEDLLAEVLQDEAGYSAVIKLQNQAPRLAELGLTCYYGFGQLSQLYGLDPAGLRDPQVPFTVLIGANVRGLGVGDTVTLGDKFSKNIEVPVAGRLPRYASFLEGGTHINYLDESILVLTDYPSWQSFHLRDTGILLQSICFVDRSEEEVHAFVAGVEEYSSFKIRPKDFNQEIGETAALFRDSAVTNIILHSLTFILVAAALISNLLMLMERNLREYAIHRLYGATLGDLAKRILFYLSFIVLPAFAIGYWQMRKNHPFQQVTPYTLRVIGALAVLTVVIAAVYPLLKLKKQDISVDLRRE
jgi:hypothetical protein